MVQILTSPPIARPITTPVLGDVVHDLTPDGQKVMFWENGNHAVGIAVPTNLWDGGCTFKAKLYGTSSLTSLNRIFNCGEYILSLTQESAGTWKIQLTADFDTTNGIWITNTRPFVEDVINDLEVIYDSGDTANDPVIKVNGSTIAITELSTPVGSASANGTEFIIGNNTAPSGIRPFAGYIWDVSLKNTYYGGNGVESRNWNGATVYNNPSARYILP